MEVSKRVTNYRKPRSVAVQRYSDALCRVKGKPVRGNLPNNRPWLGLPIDSQVEFVEWTLSDPGFNECFDRWKANGYQRRDSPTCHRIDRNKGYTTDNIKWMPHAEKSRLSLAKGQETRRRKNG